VEGAVLSGAAEAGIGLGAAWRSNFEGPFSQERHMEVLSEQYALWEQAGIAVTWVFFADPMSWCLPHVVEDQLRAVIKT